MDKILVADNSLISVWVYPARKLIHHMMKTYCHGDDFRDALLRGAEALARHQATKWLSDNRLGGAIPPEDEAWATKIWFPQVTAAGWKHWAVIQPVKIIGQLSMSRFVKRYADLGINAQMFSDPDEAMTWLDQAET